MGLHSHDDKRTSFRSLIRRAEIDVPGLAVPQLQASSLETKFRMSTTMSSTLSDTLQADLDDLSDDEDMEHDHEGPSDEVQGDEEVSQSSIHPYHVKYMLLSTSHPHACSQMDEMEALRFDDLEAVAKLNSTSRYRDIMKRVKESAEATASSIDEDCRKASLEDDPTYQLLVACNKLAVDIDNELSLCHNFIKDKYRPKFPELESLVHHPVDYARVVKLIGNEMDLTLDSVHLDKILPAAVVMVITVTSTTTTGQALSPENLDKALQGCEMVLTLDEDKRIILEFVESKMHNIAPNLSLVVGTEVAAKLMGVAGGLLALSKMPSCNVQVLGSKKKQVTGMSTAGVTNHRGFIVNCPILQQTPEAYKTAAIRLVANKCTLLARVDAYGQDPLGITGSRMRDEIAQKIQKMQEPPPAKIIKPLKAPDAEIKKRRGGRRLRKQKERYGLTDVRKAANRVNFMQPEEEYIDGDEVVGLGVLGKEGSGQLRVVAKEQKMRLSAKTAKKVARQGGGRGGTVSGLTSNLAVTGQGFELVDPTKVAGGASGGGEGEGLAQRSGTESYFSSLGGFRSIKRLG